MVKTFDDWRKIVHEADARGDIISRAKIIERLINRESAIAYKRVQEYQRRILEMSDEELLKEVWRITRKDLQYVNDRSNPQHRKEKVGAAKSEVHR